MKIHAIGGYSEFGRNMTGVTVGNETVIFDCGINVDKLAALQEGGEEEVLKLPESRLISEQIVPDDREFFKKYGKQVKAMIIGHAHLDHLGGAPALAGKYGVPIIGTPFTLEVLKQQIVKAHPIKNRLLKLNPGSTYKISETMSIEFVYATHSTPQTVMSVLHTVEGDLIYAVDFKFDEHPIIGQKTDYKRLKELGAQGVKALITDSTRVDRDSRTMSESLVREMIKDVLLWIDTKNKAVIATTFASHIARLTTLVKTAKLMGRVPVLIGRSMYNYVTAAENVGLCKLSKEAILVRPRDNNRMLKRIEQEGRGKYFIITTGHQGEPNSMLVRIANDMMPFTLLPEDIVVFCSEVIPSPVNQANRSVLDKKLKSKGVRIFKDIHVSGHCAREDMREFLKMIRPQHYIPTHGGIIKLSSAIQLAAELGYTLGKDTHLLQDGQELDI